MYNYTTITVFSTIIVRESEIKKVHDDYDRTGVTNCQLEGAKMGLSTIIFMAFAEVSKTERGFDII